MNDQSGVGKLSDEEVKEMLAKLSKHFGEPVMPVGQYCAALNLWASALRMKSDRLTAFARAEVKRSADRAASDAADEAFKFANAVDWVFMHIGKSNLLSRLIYEGESLRTEICSVHKGRWSGCAWPEKDADACACQRMQRGAIGSNVTGWLP